MFDKVHSGNIGAAASQFSQERDYWLNKLSGELVKTTFSYDYHKQGLTGTGERRMNTLHFTIAGDSLANLLKLSNASDPSLHTILTAALLCLLYRHSGNNDIIIGIPIYRQEKEGEFINTALALRSQLGNNTTFKELLLQVRSTIIEANKNQNYPIKRLPDSLNIQSDVSGFPLFEVAILLENIHDKNYIHHLHLNVIFSFLRTGENLECLVDYNASIYARSKIKRIISHYTQLLQSLLKDVNAPLYRVEMLTEEEKKQLLVDFNDTAAERKFVGTIHKLFEVQAIGVADRIAVKSSYSLIGEQHLSYSELNKKSNQLAGLLKKNGVTRESVVGIMIEPCADMVVGLLGILKAGGAYLPIDPGLPEERVRYMLEDSGAAALVSTSQVIKDISFTVLQGFEGSNNNQVKVTQPRPHIEEFDRLPRPNRMLINLANYKNKIGMASVTNCMSLQATRGCPYHCLYCHKIWSKYHVYRSAENIYSEIEYYYKKGVTNFAFIDDCFNLNRGKSLLVFELILKNKLGVQLFFPNGLRGDIMTTDYIDLMVESGTRGINLSLETASPRLQKLLRKHLDLDKFKQVMDYIASKHPDVILEMASMHGFPGETEEEALMTLDFIMSIKWLHFPYIHILKIFPNTEMEAFALEHGISKTDIKKSRNRAFHELPETLPFPKSFTRKYQAVFLNNYFLNKERLRNVLPRQMKVLSEAALVQKYNAYLPTEIKNIYDIIEFAQLEDIPIPEGYQEEKETGETIFDWVPERREIKPGVKKILFLDLSQHFSSHSMLYRVVEQPLGLISLLTYLKGRFADKIEGWVYKSGNDFDNFKELKALVDKCTPDLVGIRTLTFFKEFFHETVSLIRQWGVKAPIVTGGPYASSDYDTILKDKNVDLVVLGEGEYTMAELIEEMLKNDFKLPKPDVLDKIRGIAYPKNVKLESKTCEIILSDRLGDTLKQEDAQNLDPISDESNLAYVMYTSGSTGKPKGVMVEHRQVNNCISWMQDEFKLGSGDVIVNRTNLSFDPSVWEIFWPLYIGGGVKVLGTHQRKDAEYLIRLMAEESGLTMMYCPATLLNIMTYLLNSRDIKPRLKLPWLIIGAEPIAMEVVKNFYEFYEGKIVNTYGPTECTINNTYYNLRPDEERTVVPIGKPVANNMIYILDASLRVMPLGMSGEIYIAGASVARGYINNPEKTDLAFVPNPFGEGKLFKTGDIGRWLEDGTIEIMGRIDEQVKIRGYRIEPGEIETVLSSHSFVKECVVTVRDSRESTGIKTCKTCCITSSYPHVTIAPDGTCNICELYSRNRKYIDNYFKSPEELKQVIQDANKSRNSKYDCLLLYAGGRGAAYALYQLVDMGFKVLALTYDNGYFSKADLENLKRITTSLGVNHEIVRHENSDQILGESIKIASTVCRGCFHTSSSLAGEYSYKNDIPVVIGATLSRGQIIENKLLIPLQQGIVEEKELEIEISKIQKSAPVIDKSIFEHIDIDVVKDGSVYDKVTFVDFYRYFDINNQEMLTYLNDRDPYWKTRKTFAIYSTICPIKQIGDFGHLQAKRFHYYGAATSWEKRLGHLTSENLKEDLTCSVTAKAYEKFLKKIGVKQNKSVETGDKYLCAYFVPMKEANRDGGLTSELRDYMAKQVPPYMIPAYFMQLEQLPLTPNGKVDKRLLPEPKRTHSTVGATYVAPKTNMELILADIWKEVLGVDQVGTKDNFFDLGGSSLDIVMAGSKLNEEIKRSIPVVTLFTYPTIHSLAQYLEQEETGDGTEGKKMDRSAAIDEGKNMMKRSIQKIGGRI